MRNRNTTTTRLFSSFIIVFFLGYAFINTTNVTMKLMVLPFMICALASIAKTIFILRGKKRYARWCQKIYSASFLLFWFGFLSTWCYQMVFIKNYWVLFFSIPFWLGGLYLLKKTFFRKKENQLSPKKTRAFPFSIVVSVALVAICFVSGVIMLLVGGKDSYQLQKRTKNYLTTEASFTKYEILNKNTDKALYRLIYTYTVDGKTFTISPDYEINYIPKENTMKKVKYNPLNPKEAIFTGISREIILLLMGAFFTFGSLTFVLAWASLKGCFSDFKIDFLKTYLGLLFLTAGICLILFQNSITSSFLETVKTLGFWIIIPCLFILVGSIQIVKGIFFSKTTQQ